MLKKKRKKKRYERKGFLLEELLSESVRKRVKLYGKTNWKA